MHEWRIPVGALVSAVGAAILIAAFSYGHWSRRVSRLEVTVLPWRRLSGVGLALFCTGGAVRAPTRWELAIWLALTAYFASRAVPLSHRRKAAQE